MSQVDEETKDEGLGTKPEGQEPENPEGEAPEKPEGNQEPTVPTFGEEEDPAEEERKAPEWVRNLRREAREVKRENRKLQERVKELEQVSSPEPKIGPKPTLEGCDWDAERYEADLAQWFEDKRKVEEAKSKAEAEAENQLKSWKAKVEEYGQAKAEYDDFEESESEVFAHLNQTQQGILVQGCSDPAKMVYALGRSPAKVRELAAITDPVKFAFTAAKLEAQIKMSNKKPIPAPERVPASSAKGISGAVDPTLERLRAEAEKTGDLSKVMAYKRQLRDKQ